MREGDKKTERAGKRERETEWQGEGDDIVGNTVDRCLQNTLVPVIYTAAKLLASI